MNLETLKRVHWHIDTVWLCRSIGFRPRAVCECGVGPLEIAHLPAFYDIGVCCVGFEPNRYQFEDAKERMPHADIFNVAITETPRTVSMVLNGGSSYLEGAWAPTPTQGQIVDVEGAPFNLYDYGAFDFLILDNEGHEWTVLQQMISKPRFILIEVWKTHPHATRIYNWLQSKGYKVRISTGPEGETQLWEKHDH